MVLDLLEEVESLENLDEILKVDNIDVFFVASLRTWPRLWDYIGNIAVTRKCRAAIEQTRSHASFLLGEQRVPW